jgi:hypothetical protein
MTTWAEKSGTLPISWVKRPQSLAAELDRLERMHATDMTLARILMRLYWNRPIATRSLPNISAGQDIERYAVAANRIANQFGFNLLRDLIDGMAARVCKQMSCKVITQGGSATLFQQATKMSRLIDGLFAENKARECFERAFVDACTCRGFGAVKVLFDPLSEEVKIERQDPMSVFFRYSEGENPRNLFTRTPVPREYLQDTYPQKADALAKVAQERRSLIVGVEPSGVTSDDTVMVSEAWRLTRGDDKGKWVMTCGQIVLENEPYPYDFHQLVLFRVFPEYIGAGGVSLSRLGAPYHRWENQLVRIVHDSLRGAVPRIVQHESTVVNQGGYSDVPFSKTIWTGTEKPEIQPSNPVSEQVIGYLPTIRHQAHVDTGVNEAMSGGQVPKGITSGRALRDYRDFADARLNGPNERWADLWSDTGKAVVGICADHYRSKVVCFRAPGSDALTEIKWGDVDMKKSKYRLLFTVSSGLATSVAGRQQDVQDLQGLGLADNVTAARLMSNVCPDVAAEIDRVTAFRDLATKMVEDALDGIPQQPSPNFGPEFLNDFVRIGTQMWARSLVNGTRTPEQLECLRKALRAAKRKQAPPLPAMPQATPAAPIGPGAIVPVGVGPTPIAHNQYEARALGQMPPEPAAPQVPQP